MAQREPCPDRIFDDLGGAFGMGCVGGSLFYFLKGFFNSPSRERFIGALRAVKLRGPLIGGSFAMWGGLFSTCDCLLLRHSQQDSPMNAVVAGFVTGGVLAIRSGVRVAWRNALAGGVILSIIEGVNVGYTSIMMRQQMTMMHDMHKVQEERMARQMRGLPDFTPEELEQRMQAVTEKRPGLFASLMKKG